MNITEGIGGTLRRIDGFFTAQALFNRPIVRYQFGSVGKNKKVTEVSSLLIPDRIFIFTHNYFQIRSIFSGRLLNKEFILFKKALRKNH